MKSLLLIAALLVSTTAVAQTTKVTPLVAHDLSGGARDEGSNFDG